MPSKVNEPLKKNVPLKPEHPSNPDLNVSHPAKANGELKPLWKPLQNAEPKNVELKPPHLTSFTLNRISLIEFNFVGEINSPTVTSAIFPVVIKLDIKLTDDNALVKLFKLFGTVALIVCPYPP